MTIKLVRTDTTIPCKIDLLQGKHDFGRGKLLDCNDKRISRQHGQLFVNIESVTLTALHQNPCFYQKKGSTEFEVLKINNTTVLNTGDRFGLLPNMYWYEIIVCMDNNSDQNTDCITDNDTEDLYLDESSYKTRKETNNEEPIKKCNSDDNLNPIERSESPSLLTGEEAKAQRELLDQRNEPAAQPSNEVPEAQTHTMTQKNNELEQDSERTKNSPSKRCHSPENVEIKKIKIEDVIKSEPTVKVDQTVKAEPLEDNAGPDAKPGCSTNQMNITTGISNVGVPAPAPVRPRERCIYGAQCYRRNPAHLSQFSHPQDKDWGPGERGVCPYGASCRRKNPRHWRDHEHPPGTLPPPPDQGPRRQKVPDRNIPFRDLPPKRIRKTVQRLDWVDSESDLEYDPYATDESEEWEPESSETLNSEDYF